CAAARWIAARWSTRNGCCAWSASISWSSRSRKNRRRASRTCSRPASRSATERRRQGHTDMTKQIQDAYIVAATRTPVGKAPKGVFRNTRPDDMLAHVLKAVVAQAPGIDVNRIEDAVIGCAMPEGEQGMNVARIGVLLAGLPDTVAAQTINRFCSSG